MLAATPAPPTQPPNVPAPSPSDALPTTRRTATWTLALACASVSALLASAERPTSSTRVPASCSPMMFSSSP
eukprot:4433110-Prymnesium_polylepis.1